MFVTGGGTGLGKAIASEFARLGADIVIASRSPNTSRPANRPSPTSAPGSRRSNATSATPNRSRRHSMPPRPHSGCRVFDQQRRRQLPGPGRGHVAQRGAPSSTSPSTAPSSSPENSGGDTRRRDARLDHQCRGVVRLDRWSRFRPQRRSKGRRQEHGRDPRRRVGPVRHPGQRTRPRPDAPRGHDRRHPGQPRPHPRQGCDPTRIAGRPAPGTRWAATFLASPFARFISGHTLVVDGANWQRRSLTNPEVVTVRDQMGRGPFEP